MRILQKLEPIAILLYFLKPLPHSSAAGKGALVAI